MVMSRPKLFVLTGPTAVGKTELSLQTAEFLHCPIISADSRQMFAELPIGTAAPTAEQLARVPHHFVGNLALTDYYSAARFEEEALQVCEHHFADHDALVVSGGSMMYVDALCRGIDPLPTISEAVRTKLYARLEQEGLPVLLRELEERDPAYFARVDEQNAKRVVHALEIIYESGKRVSELLTGAVKERPFDIVKIGLQRPREELFTRINERVTMMGEGGFLAEADRVLPFRELNALNTVGYKEIFRYFDGDWALDMALDRMRKNTRVFAKKQMTWLNKDTSVLWYDANDTKGVMRLIEETMLASK
ncbi:MAG: tRNA (adenosine(37)-N6)-dimethylallyltransferase MiaA [Alloprevotella sp.]|nr:tRNA (adenosine(37)-N6)-dimethylallyltransferase MiaA [Alloprevotella sp.]